MKKLGSLRKAGTQEDSEMKTDQEFESEIAYLIDTSREMGVTRKRSNFDEKGQGPRGGSMHWPGAMVWHGTDRVFGGTGSPGGQSWSCECRYTELASFSRQGEVCSYDTSTHCDFRINFVFYFDALYRYIGST